jgi:hypothetical protein
MTSKHGRLSILVVTLTLSACTTAGGGPSSDATQPPVAIQPAPVIVQPTAAVASSTPTPVPSASPEASSADVDVSGKPTAGPTDPCSTLTQAEASQLIGATLGPGKRQVADPDTICTWAKGTTEVKVFLTAPTTPAAAKAYYEAHKSEVPEGAHLTELPDFFDGSVIAKGATPIGTIGGIFVIDGTNFFELYCGIPACSDDALKGGAQLIAGRLP